MSWVVEQRTRHYSRQTLPSTVNDKALQQANFTFHREGQGITAGKLYLPPWRTRHYSRQTLPSTVKDKALQQANFTFHREGLRESHAVILRDRVVPASQVPFPGEPSGEPGNGTWWAGTTLYRRNDSVGFFFSPVTIKLLQRIRTKTSFDQFCIRFIRIYRLLWSSARVRNELLTNHRRDIKTQGEGRWTRQG